MLKKMKCLSVFLVLLFMLQSILMPAVYATEAKDVVMEISEQQLTLTNFGNTSNSVELVWTSIGNSINAMSYDIYRNDSLIKTTESFAYTDTELTPDTEYKYMVRAKDLDGNVIAESNSINVITALNDSIADEVSIIATSSAIALEPSKSEELVKENPDFETDRFIIKYKNQNSMMRAREAFTKIDKIDNSSKNSMNNKKNSKDMDFDIIMLNKKEKLRDIVADLQKNDLENDIEYIQPDYQLSLSSNDPYYSSQWGLENNFKEVDSSNNTSIKNNLKKLPLHLRDAIDKNLEFKEFLINTPSEELRQKLMARDVPGNVEPYILMELVNEPVIMDLRDMTDTAPIQPAYLCDAGVTEAWSISTGSGITVAVIDTGVDIAHEDLAENIWVNTEEISGNGIDDDGNGKIDDTNGWNFSEDNNVVFDIENITEENHGTHIAGIIAAVKDNGKGIAGVAPSAKVMPLKVFNNGKAYTSDIINAIQYAENMGAKIVNCSWGSNDENTALKEVIQASNMLFVCAAGNSGADIDSNPVYPAAFDCSNIITVASVNKNGSLSSFSNYGEGSVDVAAPGEGIKSTLSGNAYGQNSGSSMSAAFTSGEAALLLSNLANMSTMELKDRIVQCSEHLSSLTGKISGSVKINCVNAVKDIKNDEIINVSDTAITQSSSPLTENTDDFSLFSTSAVEAQFVKIAGGNHHSLALDSNGDVWACGLNNYGELGDGTKTTRATPVKVGGLSKITAIACGSSHSMALKNDGTVWAWGNNYYGQLGDGTTTTKTTAVQVSGLSEITAIAGGYYHSLALKNDGTVWAWGYNNYGQLGDGTTATRTKAVQVSELSEITAIAGGYGHSLALKKDGTVWAWGDNFYGQLGDGTTAKRTTAVQVSGLSEIKAIAGGYYHSLALKNDGTVWAWGYNNYGQLGDGTTTKKSTAVQVSSLSRITAIACGGYHSITLKDGTVWAWGSAQFGELGDGTMRRKTTAVLVSGLSKITAIAGGEYHSLALKSDGTVWAWGNNDYGQLGDGTTTTRAKPVQVIELNNIKKIASGSYYSLALKRDGTVWAWGNNDYGQLGDGTTITRTTAVQVSGLSEITAIAGGYGHSLALKSDGTVWAWGNNDYCQLGDGTTTSRYTAQQISGLNDIQSIACGYYHSLALKRDGLVWEWGYSNADFEFITITTPTRVDGLGRITDIACGGYHNLALNRNYGTIWAWGSNLFGQIGDGDLQGEVKFTPVELNLTSVKGIACGSYHSLAIYDELSEYQAWGGDFEGQLGDGTITDTRPEAVRVNLNKTIIAIAGGGSHSLAIQDDEVLSWGLNIYGQLGNGEKSYYEYPKYSFGTPSTTVSITTACTAGDIFNLVLKHKNMKSFIGRTYTITYNTNEISNVTDLCGMTYPKETTIGAIAGTGITIIQNDPGTIKFTIDKAIPEGKFWSGVADIIVFKPAVSGQVTLNCEVE